MQKHSTVMINGPAGRLETVITLPSGEARGIALVAHPNPLFGGTLDNKVAQTLATTFSALDCVSFRMNFRGAGASEGVHDEGLGETEDWLAVHEYAKSFYPQLPVFLAGFSFGAFVMSQVAQRIAVEKLVLVGPAVINCPFGPVAPNTLVIQGELDDVIPLADVLRWATPQDLPIVVVPGADHFFHRRLHLIRDWVTLACRF
jgi:alpha/beta superfamily hydrolase